MPTINAKYEAVFIFSMNLGEEGISAMKEKFQTLIEKNAELGEVEEWGKRRLAYLINDEEEDLVARTPTVQGGYDFTKSNDVFYKSVNGVTFASLGLDTNGRYGYYIVIQLGANVGWATPYAIDTDGAYHYGTPWTIY